MWPLTQCKREGVRSVTQVIYIKLLAGVGRETRRTMFGLPGGAWAWAELPCERDGGKHVQVKVSAFHGPK